MIPASITKEHILEAIADINLNGVPTGRSSAKYNLRHGGRLYPPKYVISIANKLANGRELPPSHFSGGREANDFLTRRGFLIEGGPFRRPSTNRPPSRVVSQRHNERCSNCKNVLIEMFRSLYSGVKIDHKIQVPARIDGYASHPRRFDLMRILQALQRYRGHREFVRLKHLHRCDLYLPSIDTVVEFDESQHFTAARDVALAHYPSDLPLGFDLQEWRRRCLEVDAKDNDPAFRDEQRAWYDCLRDFLPLTKGMSPTIRVYMGGFPWCSLDPTKPADITTFKKMLSPALPLPPSADEPSVSVATEVVGSRREHREDRRFEPVRRVVLKVGAAFKKMLSPTVPIPSSSDEARISVATVVVSSEGGYTNDSRFELMRRVVTRTGATANVVLFPAGYFTTRDRPSTILDVLTRQASALTAETHMKPVVCFGVDGRDSKDQLAVAVDRAGLLGRARKFHAAQQEAGRIEIAPAPFVGEGDCPRIVNLAGKRAFLAVCYDGFGIRHRRLENPGVDLILDLIHGFKPKGEGASGDVYFAKHALAGSSKQWHCPAFGAAVFFRRPISTTWPSAVMWNQGNKSIQLWKYSDNPLHPMHDLQASCGSEKALVRVYQI